MQIWIVHANLNKMFSMNEKGSEKNFCANVNISYNLNKIIW